MSNNGRFGPAQQGGQQFPGQQPGQQFPGQQHPGQQHPGQQFPGRPQGAPQQQWQQPAPTPPKKKGKGRIVLAVVGIIAGLMVISSLVNGNDAPEAAPASTAPATTAAADVEVKQTQAAAETKAPATTAAATTAAPATTAAQKEPAGAALGTPVTSGDLEFTLSTFKCGVSVSSLGSKVEPQGQFCVLEVTVKNVGKKEAFLSDGDITLVGANELEFSASSDTFFVEGVLMFETINPGNKVAGKVYYDVPQDVVPTTAQIKSGWFTKTQTVTLS